MRRNPELRSAPLVILVAALLMGAPPGAVAQSGSGGEEGGLFLLLPMGAQGVGLGRAMTAMESGESAFWNPAGLAGLERSEFLLYHGNQVVGDATAFSVQFVRPGTGVVGLSYGLLDIERLEVTDGVGDVVGSIVVRGHQGIVSVARALTDRIRVGTNAKVVRFGMSCRGQCPEGRVQSTSYALDAGLQFRPLASRNVDLGVMVAHLGSGMRVQDVDDREPLPARLRIGASYLIVREFLEEELGFRILAEVEDRLRDFGSPAFYFGSELRAGTTDQVYVRGGYILGNENQIDGAAVGLGLRYERFEFGIARSLARGGPTAEREPVHLTLGISL
jgi:hypothetical protein